MSRALIIVVIIVAAYFLLLNSDQQQKIRGAAGDTLGKASELVAGQNATVKADDGSVESICTSSYCINISKLKGG